MFFIKTTQKTSDLEFISHYSLFLDFSKTFRSTRTNAFFRKEYWTSAEASPKIGPFVQLLYPVGCVQAFSYSSVPGEKGGMLIAKDHSTPLTGKTP